MKTLALRFLLCAFVATVLSLTASAQTAAGLIKAVKVQGEVYKLTKDGQSVKLTEGALVTESDTVTTGKGASVVLVFMNGSTVKVASDSKLAIEEFKMDPLAETIKVSEIGPDEPSVSKTKLNLTYGEVVGEVKHLHKDQGSSFDVDTPVGAAGIRGTTFRIVFRPTGNGKAFTFTLSTAEGVVLFTGTTQATGGVDVPKNKEVVVTAQVDPVTNKVTSVAIADVGSISATAVQQINDATDTIAQTASTTFTATEQKTGTTNNGSGGNGGNGGNGSGGSGGTPPSGNNSGSNPNLTPLTGG